MFGQVLHIHGSKIPQSHMQCDVGKINSLDLKALQKFPAEVHACCWSCYCTFMFGINGLVTFFVFRFHLSFDKFGKWSFAQFKQRFFEFVIVSVIEEAKGSSS